MHHLDVIAWIEFQINDYVLQINSLQYIQTIDCLFWNECRSGKIGALETARCRYTLAGNMHQNSVGR